MAKKDRDYYAPVAKYSVGFDFLMRMAWMLCICALCVFGVAFQNRISENIKLSIWAMIFALVLPLIVKKELKLLFLALVFLGICTLSFYGEVVLVVLTKIINHIRYIGLLDIIKGVVVVGVSALFLFGVADLIVNRKRVYQKISVVVKKKRTVGYGLAYVSGAAIGIILYFICKLFFDNDIGLRNTILISATISVIIMLIISGDLLELRNHTVGLIMGGWVAITAVFVLIQANILPIEEVWQESTVISILYAFVAFEVWLVLSLVLSKSLETRLLTFFIIIAYLIASVIVGLYIRIEYPQNFFRSVACIGLAFLFFSIITIPVIYIISGKLNLAQFLKNTGAIIVIAVIFSWIFLFGIICIIRWNGIVNGREEFFELMLECGAYICIAFFVIVVFCSVAILVYRIVALVNVKKGDMKVGKKEQECFGLDIILLVFLLLLLGTCTWSYVQNSFFVNVVSEIGDISETAKMPVSIIVYVCVMLMISAITVMVFKNSFSINTFKQCGRYMNNEAETYNIYAIYKLYKAEKDIRKRQEFLDVIQKDNDGKDNILFPIRMSDVAAIKITMFSFALRDFCFDLVGEILSPFKADGLITGMIKDFVSLFTGK